MARSDQRKPANRKPANRKPANRKPAKPAKPSRALDAFVPRLPQTARPAPRSAPRGAPVIGPNVWLENELRRLRHPADAGLLYEGWLQRYYRDRGRYPQDPKRAFRQAVRGCWERIERG